MPSIWTVQPADDKVELVWETAPGEPRPFWVRLKRQLSVGEDRRIRHAGWRGVSRTEGATPEPGDEAQSPELQIDWRATGMVRALIWLTDWSLTDDKDRKLALTRDVLESLHPDLFEVIENAITAHVKDLQAQKKMRATSTTGSPAPPTTSTS